LFDFAGLIFGQLVFHGSGLPSVDLTRQIVPSHNGLLFSLPLRDLYSSW
jgi:hypothetical protein